MITRITLHIVYEPNKEHAFELLRINTELARKAKGFVAREVHFSTQNPLKGYSITSFELKAALEAFGASPERPKLEMRGPDRQVHEITPTGSRQLFSHTESELYEPL